MNEQTKARLEKIAGIECEECEGDGRMPDTGNPTDGYVACDDCYGTGKRFWPLYRVTGIEPDVSPCDAEILYAVEQCLSLVRSWTYHYKNNPMYPTQYNHRYGMSGTQPSFDYADRLIAVLDCLESAIGGEDAD